LLILKTIIPSPKLALLSPLSGRLFWVWSAGLRNQNLPSPKNIWLFSRAYSRATKTIIPTIFQIPENYLQNKEALKISNFVAILAAKFIPNCITLDKSSGWNWLRQISSEYIRAKSSKPRHYKSSRRAVGRTILPPNLDILAHI
jgi:hypothetical protein